VLYLLVGSDESPVHEPTDNLTWLHKHK